MQSTRTNSFGYLCEAMGREEARAQALGVELLTRMMLWLALPKSR
jgi:hypothetical protein